MNITKYGLLLDGKLLGFSTSENSGDNESVTITYELDHFPNNVWLVDKAEHAEWVRLNNTEWYNAGYETPKNPYIPDKVKVAKVIQEIEEIEVTIPSFRTMMLFLDNIGNETDHSKFIDNPEYVQKYTIWNLFHWLQNKQSDKI